MMFMLMTVGVATGLVEPTFTADVAANLLFGIPVLLLPLAILWDAPGCAFGLWFKFAAEIIPFIVLPPLVLYAIHLQIDCLARQAGAQAAADNVGAID